MQRKVPGIMSIVQTKKFIKSFQKEPSPIKRRTINFSSINEPSIANCSQQLQSFDIFPKESCLILINESPFQQQTNFTSMVSQEFFRIDAKNVQIKQLKENLGVNKQEAKKLLNRINELEIGSNMIYSELNALEIAFQEIAFQQ
ncbi:Hypothetical_protein [Hexamita inflata]|uniref:Hypothetical_protein n=1 Tax=Hexamita inflata TaxID=28002 RepID=A0AA86PW55_9EUKA|nr:Hypothetical protein HINF_LOCUS30100 [Hexamita inflata]